MKAPILKTNEYNANKVYVPRELVENFLKNVYKSDENILCTLEPAIAVSIADVSHSIIELYLDGDYLMADIEVLNTVKGNILQDMIDNENITVDFPSCYVCEVKTEDDGKVVTSISDIKCFVTVDGLAFT